MLRVVSEAPGWAGWLCAPREWLLELTVTREAAMHIVCLTSVDDVGCKTQVWGQGCVWVGGAA